MVEKIDLDTLDKKHANGLNPEFTPKDEKDEKEPPKVEEFPPIGYFSLFRYGTGMDKLMLLVGILSAIGTAVCQPLNMLVFGDLTGNMIDFALAMVTATDAETIAAAKSKLADDIALFAIYNSAIGAVMLVLSYLSTLMFNYSGIRQSFRIRTLYFQRVLNQDIGWYDQHPSGDFASRMSDDLIKLEEGIGEKVIMFLHFQLSFVGCLIMALIKGWELALICLISLPVTMVAMGIVAYLTSKLAKNELEAYGTAGTIAEEVLSTIRTVLAFGGQEREKRRYENQLVYARDNNIRRALLTGIGFGILWFCIYASYALAFWYGVGLIIDEKGDENPTYTPSNMVTVFFSVMTGSMNFGMSSPYIEVFGVARGAAAKIFGVIDNPPRINASKGKGVQPERVDGNIVFENVKFNYPSRPDVEILKSFNLTINAGETVALVGSSGCGKSTCIQLLQRFYDPDVGAVYLDGHDLTTLDLIHLRTNIGVVGQEPVLFGTTIAENIRYGYKWATMEDIERAARKANAHRFIAALPEGYNTLVGERGALLSGGQKQRIAIARALVREPSILLLDEATSALDTNSEAKVQAALDNASKDCTTIIIAHRLSTIRGANRIVVIKAGEVVEDGTHAALMELKGEYYNLVTNQISTLDDDGENAAVMGGNDDDETDLVPHEHHAAAASAEDDVNADDVPLMKVINLNRPEIVQIVIGVIGSIFMGFAMPIFAVLFGDIIGVLGLDDEKKIREETNLYCIYFVVAGVAAGIATFLQVYMFGNAGEKLVMRVRSQMFGAMLRQEMGWYDLKENGVGALCAKLSSEAANIQGATGQRIGTIFQSIATLALSIGLSMYYEWRLGLMALAFAPIILAAVYFQQKLMKNETTGYRKSLENSTKLAVEAVSNIRTVASLGNETTFHGKYVEELLPYVKKAKKNTHFRAGVLGVARSIMFFAFAACIYYGGYLIREDNLSFEKVLKVTQSLIMGTVTIASALAFTPNFQKGLIAAGKVFKLLEREPNVADPDRPIINPSLEGDTNYANVEFKYPTRPDTQILRGLDLLVQRGATVALVGPSGCGKSTIVQLIERFYDPSAGGVSINNFNIKNLRMTDLRSNLGIVSQEPNLFNCTIGENIAYGDNSREVKPDEIIQAAREANIHNFIVSLPKGYDTPLGDKGTQLSGGQKQRVAIARALVRNPQILLLDEATSALDTESEKVVQEALDKAKQGRTCITIAHRLSTIQNADVICVISEGRVHEMGTHAQLLAQKGIYHHLYSLQNGKR